MVVSPLPPFRAICRVTTQCERLLLAFMAVADVARRARAGARTSMHSLALDRVQHVTSTTVTDPLRSWT